MEIKYLKHSQIDKTKWDCCVDHSQNRIVYAQSWYLDIVHPRWEALVANDYESVMPLTSGKKFGIRYLYQPFFTQQLGVFSSLKTDQQLVGAFLKAFPAHFRFTDIVLNKGNEAPVGEFELKKNLNYELKLNKTYSETVSGYAENTRRNLKKALRFNLTVINSVEPDELILLFRNNMGKSIPNIKTTHYGILKNVMERSLAAGEAEIYGVRAGSGALLAGAFFLKSYDSFIFLFSATNPESKEKGMMFQIVDHFIRKHAGSGITLDFEGSNIPNLARFYKSFGYEEFSYLRIKKNRLPAILKLFKK